MKETVIVCSVKDPAGTNIRDRLLESYPFEPCGQEFDSNPTYSWGDKILVSAKNDIVFVDYLDETFGDCRYLFISRHRAQSAIPSLTAHFTGNFGQGFFGGKPNEVAKYAPDFLKNYLVKLSSLRNEIAANYQITLEATHHGPTSLKSPVMFVELGSSESYWSDQNAAKAISKALVDCIDSERSYPKRAIGLGGTHYPMKLNKIELESSEVAIGQIVPKYALKYFNQMMLDQILTKSDVQINLAFVDQKGMGGFKGAVLEVLRSSGIEIVMT